ncbi:MAG: mechanosensitive ion channel [Alphaproteobacteria bacterium]|nr:mechanosensitive ion channel [Alphaproteobacteria bacterium]
MSTPILIALAVLVAATAWFASRLRGDVHPTQRRLLKLALALAATTIAWIVLPRLAGMADFEVLKSSAGALSRFIGSLWWIVFAVFAFIVLERFVWTSFANRGVQVPKLLIDVVRAIVFVFMLLGVISALFEETITGLLAASGVFAVVMGFALQSTLADLFSGIAINLQHPYRVGDWIEIDGATVGQVVEMNWRATQLRSPQGNSIVMPNSKMAAAQIVNFNLPTPRHRSAIELKLDARVPPGVARDVLERAALKATAVLRDPPPSVRVTGFEYTQVSYELCFWLDGYADIDVVRHDVSNSVWYALDVLGLGSWCDEPGDAATTSRAGRLVGYVDLFRDFDDSLRQRIAGVMKVRLLRPGDVIMREGELTSSVYIVELGAVEVSMNMGEHGPRVVARLGTGDFFGEMSLLTGEPRSATLTAMCETKIWELDRESIEPILRSEPAIADRLSRVMAKRRLANTMLLKNLTAQERQDAEQSWPDDMLGKIRRLFSLPH